MGAQATICDTIDKLVAKVMKGGSGTWGAVPMPANPQVTEADAKKLAANDYCQSCHPDSFHQWQRSAHRFSSFNNPFYRKSVELMADRVGRERTKWCSGCHDPVVLFTGQMGAATQAKFSYDQWEAQQGLTCMSCHSIAEMKDGKLVNTEFDTIKAVKDPWKELNPKRRLPVWYWDSGCYY